MTEEAQQLTRKLIILQLTDPYVHKLVVEVLVEFGRKLKGWENE